MSPPCNSPHPQVAEVGILYTHLLLQGFPNYNPSYTHPDKRAGTGGSGTQFTLRCSGPPVSFDRAFPRTLRLDSSHHRTQPPAFRSLLARLAILALLPSPFRSHLQHFSPSLPSSSSRSLDFSLSTVACYRSSIHLLGNRSSSLPLADITKASQLKPPSYCTILVPGVSTHSGLNICLCTPHSVRLQHKLGFR